jgi:enoyl-CoA hydratase
VRTLCAAYPAGVAGGRGKVEFRNLIIEMRGPVALVTFNRPDKLNALNRETLESLAAAFGELRKDAAVRAIVLTGAGEKAFVAGADIGEIAPLDAQGGKSFALFGQEIFRAIETFPKPVLAAVNGFALGGGCELAMACHIRTASENAQFGQPEVNLGVIPGYGGTQRLPRLVGKGIALELLLSGDRIGAQRAYEIGLVNAVWPLQELVPKTVELAEKLAGKAPLAVRHCLEATQKGLDMPIEEACYLEATLFGLCCATEDMKEGTAAFLQKRKADFKGR